MRILFFFIFQLPPPLGTTPVAVKQFHVGSTVADNEFISEMTQLKDLKHPNLVQLIGACKLPGDEKGTMLTGGGWSIVSEFLKGGDVEHLLHDEKNKCLNISYYNRVQIAMHAARGLAYLHDQKIIHKDIKTANLMLDGPVDQSHRFRCKVRDVFFFFFFFVGFFSFFFSAGVCSSSCRSCID